MSETSGADGPQILDLRGERDIVPGVGTVAYPVGILDTKARVIIIKEQDIVAGGGEIPRSHAAHDKLALIQGFFILFSLKDNSSPDRPKADRPSVHRDQLVPDSV